MSSRFVEVVRAISRACADSSTEWYLFGAQAALLYGARRLTADVDVTVRLSEPDPRRLIEALRRAGCVPRFDDDEFIMKTRVIPVVHEATGIAADLVVAGPGLEDLFFERVELRAFGDLEIPVARAEDLIAMKILAGRSKDLDDVRDILLAQRGALELGSIRETLGMLESALDQSDLLPELERLVQQAGTPRRT